MDADGAPRTFSEYAEARGELIARLGEYCSFCESRLHANLAVEHVLPKQHHPDLELDWHNFLLACVNCNSTKGSRKLRLGNYYWPDLDNTARAFAYASNGSVKPAPRLPRVKKRRAQRTITLVGLDKLPLNDPKASDRRWQHRLEAWGRAERARTCLEARDDEHTRQLIVDQATALGFWSIWLTVFAGDVDMRQRLITAFEGTARDCFDARTRPVPRPGGAL